MKNSEADGNNLKIARERGKKQQKKPKNLNQHPPPSTHFRS